MSMSFSQQKRPRSGDHLRTNGLVALLTRKQTLIGPNVAPLANSWRGHRVAPRAAGTTPDAGPLTPIHRRVPREARGGGVPVSDMLRLVTHAPPPLLVASP